MRKLLMTIIFCATAAQAEETTALKPWTSSIGAGLALTGGNTRTQNYNFSLTSKYDPKTRFVFKAEALYLRGSADGETQVDKASAAARGEYTLSDRTFTFGEVSYLRDPFRDINFLVAPVAGVGYRIIRSDVRNLTVDGAVGAQIEDERALGRSSSGAIKAGEDVLTSSRFVSNRAKPRTASWWTGSLPRKYARRKSRIVAFSQVTCSCAGRRAISVTPASTARPVWS